MSAVTVQSLRGRSVRGICELALAGLFVFGTQAAAARQQLIRHELDALGYALLVAVACALAGRTWWPRATLAAVLVLVGTYLLIGYPYGPVLLAVSIAVFVVVDRSPARQAPWVTLIALVALALPQLLWVDPGNPLGDAAVLLAESAVLVVPPALLAMIRQWRRRASAAEQRQALVEERLMLAREVHDVVAHNLSMVSIQAGAALRVFEKDPQQAKQVLALIHRTNQESLADLRRTLDVLRRPCEADADGAPGAGLIGMRERAEAAGGLLTWGPAPGAGFQVSARLPRP